MERRTFVFQAGTVMTAAMLSPGVLVAGSRGTGSIIPERRPDPEVFSQPILKAIALGMNSPSPHNTQAWKFKILSDTSVLLFVDEDRLLPSTDPPARQIHIGCGCFLETLRLGASTLGLKASIEQFPEGTYDLIEVGMKPVAKISVASINTTPLPLADKILSRQTNRSFYHGEMISNDEFNQILQLSVPTRSIAFLVNQPSVLQELMTILYEGMEVETSSYDPYDESRIWFRSSQKRIETKRDGISLRTDGTNGIGLALAEFFVNEDDATSWHKPGTINAYMKRYREKVMTAKGVVYFKTDTNTQQDWVQTGIDYVRFQLAADKLGFVIHPMNQVIQEYHEMNELRDRFNTFVDVSEPAKVQMIVRIGRAEKLYYSYRRNLQDVIVEG